MSEDRTEEQLCVLKNFYRGFDADRAKFVNPWPRRMVFVPPPRAENGEPMFTAFTGRAHRRLLEMRE